MGMPLEQAKLVLCRRKRKNDVEISTKCSIVKLILYPYIEVCSQRYPQAVDKIVILNGYSQQKVI